VGPALDLPGGAVVDAAEVLVVHGGKPTRALL
jgi:hypothetical protein